MRDEGGTRCPGLASQCRVLRPVVDNARRAVSHPARTPGAPSPESISVMTSHPSAAAATAPAAPSRARLWIVGFLLLAAAGGAYYKWGRATEAPTGARGRFGGMGGPPQAVPVRLAPVSRDTIEVQVRALGTVTPLNTVDGAQPARRRARARAVHRRPARPAGAVARRDRRPRPYEVALCAGPRGSSRRTRRGSGTRRATSRRYQRLASEGLITKQQVTTQEALVQQYQGALQANEAQVNNAKLQLAYTKVVAPIDGRLGLRQVDAGNLVRSRRPERPGRDHPDAPDLGALHRARSRAARGARGRCGAGDRLPVRGLGPRREGAARRRRAARRWTTRSTPPPGSIKLRAQFANGERAALPEPVREHPAAGEQRSRTSRSFRPRRCSAPRSAPSSTSSRTARP